jgi:iron(III) transport system permease protein
LGRGWRLEERVWLVGLGLLVVVMSLWPLLRLASEIGSGDLALIDRVFARPQTWVAAWNSLALSTAAALIAVVIGAGMALVLTITDVPQRGALAFLFLVPLVIPPQITALAWMQLAGPGSPVLAPFGLDPPPGTVNPLYSHQGIALLLGIEQAPMVFLTVRVGLGLIQRDLVEAARLGGARPAVVIATVIAPLLLPWVVGGALLAFAASVGNFGIPAVLGIPARVSVLPTLIYQRLSGFGPRVLPEVAVLSALLAVMVIAALVAAARCLRRRNLGLESGGAIQPFLLGRWRPFVLVMLIAGVAVLVVAPMAALVGTSLAPAIGVAPSLASLDTSAYRFVLIEHAGTRRAMVNSLALSMLAAALLVAIAVPLAELAVARRSRLVQALIGAAELPYALPGTVLAIGCILVFLPPLPLVGVSLYGTFGLLLIAYLARFLPLVVKPVRAALAARDPRLDEAAMLAGSGFTRRLIDFAWPAARPAAAAGACLVVLIALNELTVSALLWSAGWETLGVMVFTFEQGGAVQAASALSVVISAGTVGLMLIADRLGRDLPPGVLPWRG